MRTNKENEELNNALRAEKMLTFEWYQKMSQQVPWKLGDRERYEGLFKTYADKIRRLQGMDTAEWFAGLSE